jgi:transposase
MSDITRSSLPSGCGGRDCPLNALNFPGYQGSRRQSPPARQSWARQAIDALIDEVIAHRDAGCERLMSVPGIGPIISSAIVAAINAGDAFAKGRDFAAWLGLVPKQISTGDRTILGKISKRGNR